MLQIYPLTIGPLLRHRALLLQRPAGVEVVKALAPQNRGPSTANEQGSEVIKEFPQKRGFRYSNSSGDDESWAPYGYEAGHFERLQSDPGIYTEEIADVRHSLPEVYTIHVPGAKALNPKPQTLELQLWYRP